MSHNTWNLSTAINSVLNTMSHANVAQLYPGGYVPEEQQTSQLKRRVAELEAENRKLKRGMGPAHASSGKQTWSVKNDSWSKKGDDDNKVKFCFKWNQGSCKRSPCPFKHACQVCGKNHKVTSCPGTDE